MCRGVQSKITVCQHVQFWMINSGHTGRLSFTKPGNRIMLLYRERFLVSAVLLHRGYKNIGRTGAMLALQHSNWNMFYTYLCVDKLVGSKVIVKLYSNPQATRRLPCWLWPRVHFCNCQGGHQNHEYRFMTPDFTFISWHASERRLLNAPSNFLNRVIPKIRLLGEYFKKNYNCFPEMTAR